MSVPRVHFLIVDDDDDHAELIALELDDAPISCSYARVRDGEEALAYVRGGETQRGRRRPQVILLDLKLPGLDGHEVLREIKGDPELRSIRVVVLSTSGAEPDVDRAYRHHADSYMVKPVDFDRFQQMIRSMATYWGLWNATPVALPRPSQA